MAYDFCCYCSIHAHFHTFLSILDSFSTHAEREKKVFHLLARQTVRHCNHILYQDYCKKKNIEKKPLNTICFYDAESVIIFNRSVCMNTQTLTLSCSCFHTTYTEDLYLLILYLFPFDLFVLFFAFGSLEALFLYLVHCGDFFFASFFVCSNWLHVISFLLCL